MVIEADLPKDFVDSFNAANPNINLIRVEENWDKWLVDAMAGTAPDLARLGQGSDVPYFSRRGLLLDMTDYLKKSNLVKWDDIDKVGNGSYQFDGTEFGKGSWYGLSKDYNNIGCITYNTEMFADAGLPKLSTKDPITYPDLYELAKKLTIKDSAGAVKIWGLEFAGNWVPYWASDMAYAAGTFFYTDDTRSKMNNDPAMRDIFKYWARYSVEDISSNVRNPAAGWTGAAFQSDRVAMVQLGYWYGAQLQENENYETKYAWAPTPILRTGAKRVTNTLGATGIVIFAKSKYPDRAFRVFEWYMGREYGIHRAKTGWGIPPLMSLRKYLPRDNEYNKARTEIAFDDAFVDRYYKEIDTELEVGKEELGL